MNQVLVSKAVEILVWLKRSWVRFVNDLRIEAETRFALAETLYEVNNRRMPQGTTECMGFIRRGVYRLKGFEREIEVSFVQC